jgi:hypothetical protein
MSKANTSAENPTKLAYIALTKGEYEKFKTMEYDAWYLGKLIANKPKELAVFLSSIDYEKTFPNGIPGCILRHLTPETKKVYDNFFKNHGGFDNIDAWYYKIPKTYDDKYRKDDEMEYPSFDGIFTKMISKIM